MTTTQLPKGIIPVTKRSRSVAADKQQAPRISLEQDFRRREHHSIEFLNRHGEMEKAPVVFIEGTSGRYCLTVTGRVIGPAGGSERKDSHRRELRLATGTDGYVRVGFRYDTQRQKGWYVVHRLMAKEFLEAPTGLDRQGKPRTQVNHLDGNVLNNKISNLCWMSAGENQNFNRVLHKADEEKQSLAAV